MVRAAKVIDNKPTEYRIEGRDGLILLCQPSGTATFFLTYAVGKSRRRLKLGRRGVLDLASARQLAVEKLAEIGRGADLVADIKARRVTMTFGELVEAYMAEPSGPLPATKADYMLALARDVLPAIASKPVIDVTADNVADALDGIEARGKLVQADRTRAAISSVLTWGIKSRRAKGLRVNVARMLPTRSVPSPRSRGISDDEFRALWFGLGVVTEPVALAARLCWITGSRRSEVAGARIDEFDHVNARWTIPGDTAAKGRLVRGRTKSGAAKIVALSTHAVSMIRRAIQLSGSKDYAFSSQEAGSKLDHLTPHSLTRAVVRVRGRAKLVDVRLHDGRAACRTWLRTQGYSEQVLDAVLGYSGRSVGERHCTATSVEFVERQLGPALQAWSDHIAKVIDEGSRTKSFVVR